MKRIYSLIALCVVLSVNGLKAQDLTAQKLNDLGKGIAKFQELGQFEGSVLIHSKGEFSFEKSYGLADQDKKIPNSSATRYNIGSIGKSFTAVLILQLAQEGKVDLDKPVSTYLEHHQIPNGDRITLRQLLSHTSGLGNYMEHPEYMANLNSIKSIDQVMPYVISTPVASQIPGAEFHYSNSGFIVLGKVIEDVTGLPYGNVLYKKILSPSGMQASTLIRSRIPTELKAIGYQKHLDGSYENTTATEPVPLSDGGLYATASDLEKFGEALLGGKLLNAEFTDKLFSLTNAENHYALGWMVEKGDGYRKLFHFGGTSGRSSALILVPEKGLTLVVLSNRDNAAVDVAGAVSAYLLDGKAITPHEKSYEILFGQIKEKGFPWVKENCRQILLEKGIPELKNPASFLILKNELSHAGMQTEAEGVDELVLNWFSNNESALIETADLALHYFEKPDKALARKALEAATHINPDNKSSREMLEKVSGKAAQ